MTTHDSREEGRYEQVILAVFFRHYTEGLGYFEFHKDEVLGVGQVELDALYAGVDTGGQIYVLPIEAKSRSDHEMIGRVQVAQMVKSARQDFPGFIRRPLAVKMLADDSIGIVEFSDQAEPDALSIHAVRRYRLIRQRV
ncbi:MAG: hypothetical protein L6Q98_22585 [Anaerolineae bacterium]|nr:hypothetical protein [Anaerolineae bacterium]NUQ06091.1 hypothetical protein [Anaerolineae bacterium]